jgi:ABC-2 type transport system permease protein
MNTESNNVPEASVAGSQPNAPRPLNVTRPFYWSVRRELWENRSIYLAPLIAAAVVLFGVAINAFRLPQLRMKALALEPVRQRTAIELPYDGAAVMIMFTVFIVGIFYCLDALYGERKDRSILFWKSVPVSDAVTVLSKVFVPMVILPVITFVIIIATQFIMLLISTAVLLPSGLAGTTWTLLAWPRLWLILLYGLVTSALWEAPVYAWMLLVSSWAKRATFLWAVLPWLAIGAIEKLAFDTSYFARMLVTRLTGGFQQGFLVVSYPKDTHAPIVDRFVEFEPLKFLTSPGLWIGLAFAAICLTAAVRLRRYRGPI